METRDLRHLLKPPSEQGIDLTRAGPPPVPLARKFHVFPMGEHRFACGFCRRQYRTQEYAWMCVATCAEPVLQEMHVSALVQGLVSYYFCPVCLKNFPNREDAELCLERCRDHVMSLLPSEATRLSLLSAYSAESQKRTRIARDLERGERILMEKAMAYQPSIAVLSPSKLTHEDMNQIVPIVNSKIKLEDLTFAENDEAHPSALVDVAMHGMGDVFASKTSDKKSPKIESPQPDSGAKNTSPLPTSDSEKQNDAQDVEKASVLAAPSDSGADTSEETPGKKEVRIKWRPGMKSYRRDGAQYVCNGCHAKFFSKTEAEKCFLSHPVDKPG